MTRLRHRLSLLALCAALAVSLLAPIGQGQTLQIDTLKANYVEAFLDFVRWEGELKTETATIGVLGSREFASHLERIAATKTKGRALRIVRVEPGDDLTGLQILFVGKGNRNDWNAIGDACRHNQILLVGEEDGFCDAFGAVEFVVRKNRLRFRLSLENAERCGIEVSSKLAEMAVGRS